MTNRTPAVSRATRLVAVAAFSASLISASLGAQEPQQDQSQQDQSQQDQSQQNQNQQTQTQTRAELEARLQEVESRLEKLEKPPVETKSGRYAARQEDTHVTREGFLNIPGSDFALKVGGYVKLDMLHDFQEVGNEFKLATRTITVPTERESRTTLNARESRLNFDLRGPVNGEEGRIFVEGDFYGEGGAFQLRHAFGEVHGVLAGQTWTTFMDLSSRPHTLDFEGPDAELFVRQPMIRYTHPLSGERGKGSSFSIAVEDSNQDLSMAAGSGFMGSSSTPLPDLTGNVRLVGETAHVQFSGVLRLLDFDGDAGAPNEDAVGYGFAVSGLTELGDPGRRLMGQASFGEGVAQYNQAFRGSGSDAVVEAGNLETLPILTAVVGYEHDWCKAWTSTAAFSIADVDTVASQAATAMAQSQSASVNLVWHPDTRFMTGIEYLWGQRENRDGQNGHAHRLQFSIKYSF